MKSVHMKRNLPLSVDSATFYHLPRLRKTGAGGPGATSRGSCRGLHFPVCIFTSAGASALCPPGETVRVCGARQWSMWLILCTQPMVQLGAQLLAVKNSRFTSAVVYPASGTPGYPLCCEQ